LCPGEIEGSDYKKEEKVGYKGGKIVMEEN
jgi:hypothetical protein